MEEEYGIKVSQYTVEAEEHIADDREKPRGAAGSAPRRFRARS